RIVRRHFVKLRCQQTANGVRRHNSDCQADNHWPHPLVYNQAPHVAGLRAECHAHPYLASPLLDAVRDRAVNADARKQQRDSRKNSQEPHHQTRLSSRLRNDSVHHLRDRNRDAWIHFRDGRLHQFRDRIEFQAAANGNVEEWKILLRPRTIKFHVRRFDQALRTHVSDDAHNFHRRAVAGDEQRFADGIFVRKNFFRACLTNETDVPAIGDVVFIEVAPCDERDSPDLEVARHDVVTRRARSVFPRWHIAVRTRVKRTTSKRHWNIAADSGALDAHCVDQCGECLLNQTLTRRLVWIARGRQVDRADPEVMRLEPQLLLAEANETGDKQRGAGKQTHRKCDLCAHENLSESLLPKTSTRSTPSFLHPPAHTRV